MAQSDTEKISGWKQRAAIDYVPPFMNLWLCLNAWMNKKYSNLSRERDKLNKLKKDSSSLLDRFQRLLRAEDLQATLFKSYFADLHRALESADIPYHKSPDNIVRFDSCLIDQTINPLTFESILVQPGDITTNESGDVEQKPIKLDDDVWIEGDTERLFKAYIEIVYQIRCNLFHGDLVPDSENHRVIRLLYSMLWMIMEDID